ncbi:hypothetical protein I656_01014 [Geobacillus sp. WSUCF1]|nr:hypothetical protein I656_01014 [Geobacillus sp. WSUCF1]
MPGEHPFVFWVMPILKHETEEEQFYPLHSVHMLMTDGWRGGMRKGKSTQTIF